MSQMNQDQYLQQLGQNAKQASYALANLTASQKADLLEAIADALTANSAAILAANAK
ncbi:MAG TPA: gamma-glutamyl-phosphate reductase, partial [Shewanella sp.]|nr:gamma-glutamyl-phosphate reductase [Shewanella sp.]